MAAGTARGPRCPASSARAESRRFRAARLLVCAGTLLLSGCVYMMRHTPPGACHDAIGSPIRNFCVVQPGVLWRAEGPTRADAGWLLRHGVRSVISLGFDARFAFESVRLDPAVTDSVTYYRISDFSALKVVTHRHLDEDVARVLAVIEAAPKPVLINCRAGVDRTGIVVAAYRMLIEGRSARRAIREMDRFHSPWDPLNARYVRSLAGPHAAVVRRAIRAQESAGLKPTGRFDCHSGGCRFSPG